MRYRNSLGLGGASFLLKDARTRGQYLSYGLSREGAEICLNTAREVIDLVRKVWGDEWCSG
jgi:HEPN domain.